MTTPAPIDTPEYAAVREWTGIMAELFVPQTNAFSEIWLDGEKVASTMYWKRHIKDMNNCEGDGAKVDEMIQEEMYKDTGRGIVTGDTLRRCALPSCTAANRRASRSWSGSPRAPTSQSGRASVCANSSSRRACR